MTSSTQGHNAGPGQYRMRRPAKTHLSGPAQTGRRYRRILNRRVSRFVGVVLAPGLLAAGTLVAATAGSTATITEAGDVMLPATGGLRGSAADGSSPGQARFTLPAPTGRERVGTVSLHLVDSSRPDPWVPDQSVRQLMVQVWYPAVAARGYPYAPWMTPVTARAYERAAKLPVLNWPMTAGHLGAPVRRRAAGWPVLLYSHGLGGERTETTALVEDLASHGYIVVTIDHIHDAGVVELPGGHLETSAIPELTDDNEVQVTTKAIDARVADVRFVLDQLTVIDRGGNPDAEHRSLPRGLRGALDLRHVGIFGHSDGGATAAAAVHDDPRFTAGVNLDGTLWTPAAAAGSDRPFLLFGRQGQDRGRDESWAAFWARQRGPKLQLHLADSGHLTFTDLAVLIPQAAPIVKLPPEKVTEVLGTIDGHRATSIVRTYVSAFFDRYLRHRRTPLLNGPSAHYPEVRFTAPGD